jgi:hypothetical protein
MRVLYLSMPEVLQPWYEDFLSAVGGKYPVDLYNPHRPLAE